MNRLDDELRWALGRREPPPGFAGRVMQRIPRPWWTRFSLPPRWVPVMAALLVAVFALATWDVSRARRQREARQAAEEFHFALQVTSRELGAARTKLLHQIGGTI